VNIEFLCDKMGLVVLSSSSSRRKSFLENKLKNTDFELIVSPISKKEPVGKIGIEVSSQVEKICKFKSDHEISEISKKMPLKNIDLVVVSDTLLEDPEDSKIPIGKPKNKEEALSMLLRLSGKRHRVWSSSGILFPPKSKFGKMKDGDWRVSFWTDYSIVEFDHLNEDRIIQLIESGSWINKAGGYDIMGEARENISLIGGEEVTVLGFSCRMVVAMFQFIYQ